MKARNRSRSSPRKPNNQLSPSNRTSIIAAAATAAIGMLLAASRADLTAVTVVVAIIVVSSRAKFKKAATEVMSVVAIAADVSSERTAITRFIATNGITGRTGMAMISKSSRTPQSSSAVEATTKSNTTLASITASLVRTTDQATEEGTEAVTVARAVLRAKQRGNLRRLAPGAEMSD